MTLCGKNLYGALKRCPSGYLYGQGNLNYYVMHLSLPNNTPPDAVWSPGLQEGKLVVFRLPDPGPDKSYQLWITDPRNRVPASAGAFTVDPAATNTRIFFKTDRPVPAGAAFAISVERRDGATNAEGPIVLSSQ